MDAVTHISRAREGAGEARTFSYAARAAGNVLAIVAAESLVLFGSVLAGGLIRWLIKGDPMVSSWMGLLVAAWILGAWFARLLPGWGLGAVEELRRSVIVLAVVFACTTAMLFWEKASSETSRLTLTLGFLLSLLLVPLARLQVKRRLLEAGRWGCPTVIYGDSETAPLVVRALREEPGLGYVPAGLFLDNPEDVPVLHDLPVLGRAD